MATAMSWLSDTLRVNPEIAWFLALAGGYLLGRLRIRSFRLGAVVGCLLAGIVVGQLGIVIPGVISRTFFLFFLFSIGFKVGPQFFRSFGRSTLQQMALTLLFDVTGFLTVFAVATLLGFNAGTAAGLLSGGLHTSEALGTGNEAIARLAVAEEVRRALTSDAAVAYAVTYLVAIFMGIFMLVKAGPWLMRVDIRAECKKLEDELGMKQEDIGVVSAYKQFVMRAYRVPKQMSGWSIAEIENGFLPDRVFVERVSTTRGFIDVAPDLRLHEGNLIVLSGRPGILGGAGNPLQASEVEDPQLLDIPAITVEYVLERKDLVHRTLTEIVDVLERDVTTRGVYLRKVMRAGQQLPLGSKVVLERGDVLTLVGAKPHVDRVAARLGSVERPSNATDVIWLCLAIGVGGLVGLPGIHLAGLKIGLGLPVGVLLASFLVGWLHSVRPHFCKVPEPVIWLLDSLGLNGFLAAVGINAGPSFVRGLRSSGLELLIAGLIVCVVPYFVTILVGRYVFRIHPGVLLGMCAGSGTTSPGLAAIQEKTDSRVPVLGYGVSYAISALIYALWGSLIVAVMTRNS
jgi:putative transport protein